MVNFKDVTKVFKPDLFAKPFVALDSVSFSIPEGSMVGFLGANGAGKTTSLKIMMDFIRPTSGTVTFAESLGKTRLEIFKNVGFLPERPYFYPNLTGEEFLFFMGELSDLTRAEVRREINRWASRFKIEYALKRELKTYSKGMLQRTGFLATILHQPKLIILDEPISGLDPIGRKELKDVIVEVHKEGKTVFFSSHIVPGVEEICDRVVFLKEGKLIYDGSVNSILVNNRDADYHITARAQGYVELRTPIKLVTQLPDGMRRYVISRESRDQFLAEVLEKKLEIVSMEMSKLTLEEIFYHTQETT